MAKGYWIASVDVSDTEAYAAYVRENAVAFAKYGARFLVRGGTAEAVEGRTRSRIVVLDEVTSWQQRPLDRKRSLNDGLALASERYAAAGRVA